MVNCPIDIEDKYPFVVKVNYQDNVAKTLGVHCTGSIINQRYVILAAHCVVKPSLSKKSNLHQGLVENQEREIFVGIAGDSKGPYIKKIFVHPNYKDTFLDSESDLAIIELETSFSNSGKLDFESIPINSKINIVGTGLQKMHSWNFNDGQRRAGTNEIDRINTEGIWLKEVTIPSDENSDSFSFPKCIATGGDSGSPLLVNDKIRGIFTSVSGRFSPDGSEIISQRYVNIATEANKNFIDLVINSSASHECEHKLNFPIENIENLKRDFEEIKTRLK